MRIIATSDEYKELLAGNGNKLIVIDFYADWCGPCRSIAPKVLDMEKEFTDVVFAKVNVDENSDVSEKEEVSAMPTFLFYKGGVRVDILVGASEAKLKALVEKHK